MTKGTRKSLSKRPRNSGGEKGTKRKGGFINGEGKGEGRGIVSGGQYTAGGGQTGSKEILK